MSDEDSQFQAIGSIAESLQALNHQAVREYQPVVESIVRSRSRDTHRIEHLLDEMLGFCGHEPMLVLFKTLCRHLWDIDPTAAADYVRLYRAMWDEAVLSEESRPAG